MLSEVSQSKLSECRRCVGYHIACSQQDRCLSDEVAWVGSTICLASGVGFFVTSVYMIITKVSQRVKRIEISTSSMPLDAPSQCTGSQVQYCAPLCQLSHLQQYMQDYTGQPTWAESALFHYETKPVPVQSTARVMAANAHTPKLFHVLWHEEPPHCLVSCIQLTCD